MLFSSNSLFLCVLCFCAFVICVLLFKLHCFIYWIIIFISKSYMHDPFPLSILFINSSILTGLSNCDINLHVVYMFFPQLLNEI